MKKVEFPGHGVFVLADDGRLVPFGHEPVNVGDKHTYTTHFGDTAYAVVSKDGNIRRYQLVIGCESDLREVK